jgi:hypothetical protein
MTDVRRTAAPSRLKDGGRLGIEFIVPVAGDLDHVWRAAFHEELLREAEQRELPDRAAFARSLSLRGNAITFFMAPGETTSLGGHLDAIDAAIRSANSAAEKDAEETQMAFAKAQREVNDRDRQLDDELRAWSAAHPAGEPMVDVEVARDSRS